MVWGFGVGVNVVFVKYVLRRDAVGNEVVILAFIVGDNNTNDNNNENVGGIIKLAIIDGYSGEGTTRITVALVVVAMSSSGDWCLGGTLCWLMQDTASENLMCEFWLYPFPKSPQTCTLVEAI